MNLNRSKYILGDSGTDALVRPSSLRHPYISGHRSGTGVTVFDSRFHGSLRPFLDPKVNSWDRLSKGSNTLRCLRVIGSKGEPLCRTRTDRVGIGSGGWTVSRERTQGGQRPVHGRRGDGRTPSLWGPPKPTVTTDEGVLPL